jgi:hypothetical protein
VADKCYEPGEAFTANSGKVGAALGGCEYLNVTSLYDLCGVCRGDFSACFFSSVIPVSSVAGIAAGAAVGIAIAAIIGVLLFLFLTKKGYDYYKAKGAVDATNVNNNPYFKVSNSYFVFCVFWLTRKLLGG